MISLKTVAIQKETEREYGKLEELWPRIPERTYFDKGVAFKSHKIINVYAKIKIEQGEADIIEKLFDVKFEDPNFQKERDYFLKFDLDTQKSLINILVRFERATTGQTMLASFKNPNILLQNIKKKGKFNPNFI